MEQLIIPDQTVPAALRDWLQQHEGRPLLAAIEVDSSGDVVFQPLPDVDPSLVPRVLKSMAQYAEVLRRLA